METASSGLNFGVLIGIALISYIVFALPFYRMGQKIGSDNPWYAFVPILNLVLMLEIADKELWWILLLFVPCVNIVVMLILWMAIAERMEKPGWVGLLMLVPGVNCLVPFYLAYG